MLFGLNNAPKKSLIAIVSSAQAEAQLKSLLKDSKEYRVSIKKTDDVIENGKALVNGSADVVVLEADLENPKSDAVLEDLCEYVSANGAMIVISDSYDARDVRKLFKLGVNDVLSLPLNKDEFFNSIQSASEATKSVSNTPRATGKVISVVKANGGVGGTTVALNLARHITKAKAFERFDKRELRVAVFDFNVQFGSAALNLNLKPKANLMTVMQAETRLDEDLLYASVIKHDSGIFVLAAPTEIVPGSAFSAEFMENLIDLAVSVFDFVVIDMPLMWTGWTPQVLKRSDAIVAVLQPFVEHVHNASKLLDGLDRLDIEKNRTMIVLNELGKGSVFKQRAEQIGQRLKRPVCVRRRDDTLHQVSSDRGILLDKASGNKVALKELEEICAELNVLLGEQELVSGSMGNISGDIPNYMRANP